MARYGSEHKAQSRERVVAEAAKAIREQGPHGVSVAGVMGAAGLTHGAFYAHFPSRDALLAAGVARMFEDSRARLELSAAEGADARQALTSYINFYLSRSHRDARTAGCPLPFLSAEAPRLTGETRALFARGVAGLTGKIAGLLESAGFAEPQITAASVLAELVGAVSLARAEPDAARSDAILKASRSALKARLGLDS
ncbi:TetR/AcrR family transcriptional regulator [Phenylobacterium sp.]|uniref:TetR/AcrR family transcriptional regulator n=1 Tax=Phenylobacterium sp. TaxID=1871053 RepID=UPI0025CBDFFE|nr:TetR/AcrR family transcriptional regulator [Phenylobacterium sp.]